MPERKITLSADSQWLLKASVIRYQMMGYRKSGEPYFQRGEHRQDMKQNHKVS